jgi:hypothetical protein
MTARAALVDLFLKGRTLTIKNCFTLVGLTNLPREVTRQIEVPFEVKVSRTQKEGVSRYGQSIRWNEYKLEPTKENMEGIEKMKAYLASQNVSVPAIEKTVVREHVRNLNKKAELNVNRLF